MKPTFTHTAKHRAEKAGITLCEKMSRNILSTINNKSETVWEDIVSKPENLNCRLFFMEHDGVRLRVVTDDDITRIVTMNKSSGTPLHVISKAEKFGITLNKDMQRFIANKIVNGDPDVFSIEKGQKPHVKIVGMTIMDQDYKIVFSDASGVIINIDKTTTLNSEDGKSIIRTQHPSLSQHAAERAAERYDVELTKEMTASIIERIRLGDYDDNYGAGGDTRAVVLDLDDGVKGCVIYTPFPTIKIITVAPMDYHERRTKRQEKSKEAKKKRKSQLVKYHGHLRNQENECYDLY